MQRNSLLPLFQISKTIWYSPALCSSLSRNYAKPAAGIMGLGKKGKLAKAGGPALEKKVLPVETDPNKLVNYVCGSCITKEGEDIKLKDDSEYPDWLWNLRLGPAPPLEELDPNTHYFWYRHRKEAKRRTRQVLKLKKF